MTSTTATDLRGIVSKFWRWWTAELAALVPADWRLPGRSAASSRIWLSAGEVRIDRISDGIGERLVDLRPIEALDDDAWGELAALTDGTRSELVLSAPDIFSTSVRLPKAARSRLESAVALQMLEVAPLEPHLLTWALHPPVADGDHVNVRVTMAKRARIDALAALFEARDIPMPPVLGSDGDALVMLARGARIRGTMTRARLIPIVATALLVSIPLSTWLGATLLTASNAQRANAFEQQVAPKVAAAAKARQAERLRSALAPMLAPPPVTTVLEDLAARLPASASLTVFERRPDGLLTITVDATDPEAVRAGLNASTLDARWRERDQAKAPDGRLRIRYLLVRR